MPKMFALLFLSLLFVNTGHALQCMSNCSISAGFGEPFLIPDGRCQQRASSSTCSTELRFQYNGRTYTVEFNKFSFSYDSIYITSGPYFSYSINYACSKNTDCSVTYAQNRIDEMVARDYDASRIYGELAPLIDNPSRNGSLQCYDISNKVVTCSPDQFCSLELDTKKRKMKSRGCATEYGTGVYLFDGDISASLSVTCARNLCNGDAILGQIKSILAKNGLTDPNGRRIAAGTKEMASFLSVTIAFIFVLVCYF
jgi:hypothetical protein